ncbi:MAG: hypothetical protein Q4D21_05210 [Phascolarctobacterium sp.]|nr:hypothetical protein [Phascolarctobacterium sp.]
MKKLCLVLVSILMLCVSAIGFAADTGSQIPTSTKISEISKTVWNGAVGKSSKIGVVYLNNAKTTYDDEIDYKVLESIIKQIKPTEHTLVDATNVLNDLQAMGVNDISLAERADIIDSLKNSGLDYAVIVQVDPFVRKERMAMFRYTLEMTSSIPVKVVDVQGNKYLYNGKITEFAKHGTAVGGVSNKSTVMKVLDLVAKDFEQIIARIPK